MIIDENNGIAVFRNIKELDSFVSFLKFSNYDVILIEFFTFQARFRRTQDYGRPQEIACLQEEFEALLAFKELYD